MQLGQLAGLPLAARGLLGWQHAFGDVTPARVLAFTGAASTFIIAGVPTARDAAVVQAGLDLRLSPATTFGLSYAGLYGDYTIDSSVRGKLEYRF